MIYAYDMIRKVEQLGNGEILSLYTDKSTIDIERISKGEWRYNIDGVMAGRFDRMKCADCGEMIGLYSRGSACSAIDLSKVKLMLSFQKLELIERSEDEDENWGCLNG